MSKQYWIKFLWTNVAKPICEEFVMRSDNKWDDKFLDALDEFVNDFCTQKE